MQKQNKRRLDVIKSIEVKVSEWTIGVISEDW
jgi:hypothetical protein